MATNSFLREKNGHKSPQPQSKIYWNAFLRIMPMVLEWNIRDSSVQIFLPIYKVKSSGAEQDAGK